MTILVVFVAIAIIVIAISVAAGRRTGQSGRFQSSRGWSQDAPPQALGVPEGHPARSAAERLEASFGYELENKVKQRLLSERPHMTDAEWNWTWFELKRFFLMCGILKGVPMYSRQADAVWHELLLFTREYEQSCIRFCGDQIHHAPHGQDESPEPGERAWFDWVYGELFVQTPASGRIWGAFYRTRMDGARLERLTTGDADQLRTDLFNRKAAEQFADLRDVADYLIGRAKSQLSPKAGNAAYQEPGADRWGYDPAIGMTGVLTAALLTNSFMSQDQFDNAMDGIQTEEQREANGSGYPVSVCGGTSDHSSHDGGGGHDSGSGSDGGGSSCGGGCGGGGE
ncbi:hypothetical protein [Paenibacillus sp. NPDC058071]|uniref:hypothetical protein n=1 Tax=Paenibacillus sp. NPDC058071 TaxID=3346326 RepID=UPI0036DF4341